MWFEPEKAVKTNAEKKRKRIINLLKMWILAIVFFFYFLLFKISVFLVNYNLFSQYKELFWTIASIETSIKDYTETNNKAGKTNNLGEKIKARNQIKEYKKVEEEGLKKIETMIKENVILYGFFCNSLKDDYPNVYNTHYINKCNDEQFMSMIFRKIL